MKKALNKKYMIACVILLIVIVVLLFAIIIRKDDVGPIGKDVNIEFNGGESIECITIDTKYGVLYYPKRWSEYLRLEEKNNNKYAIEFYAELDGKEKIHLFDIKFNGSGTAVKSIKLSDGSETTIFLKPYKPKFDDTWTEDEKLVIMEMQEDVNYLLEKLDLLAEKNS